LKVRSKRDRRRAILHEELPGVQAPAEWTLIRFGSPRRPADRCTLIDAPAQFALCLDCAYNRGAHGDGIQCAHRFGIDPTLVDGTLTQIQGDQIIPLE
jgi:hypothetical protein